MTRQTFKRPIFQRHGNTVWVGAHLWGMKDMLWGQGGNEADAVKNLCAVITELALLVGDPLDDWHRANTETATQPKGDQ